MQLGKTQVAKDRIETAAEGRETAMLIDADRSRDTEAEEDLVRTYVARELRIDRDHFVRNGMIRTRRSGGGVVRWCCCSIHVSEVQQVSIREWIRQHSWAAIFNLPKVDDNDHTAGQWAFFFALLQRVDTPACYHLTRVENAKSIQDCGLLRDADGSRSVSRWGLARHFIHVFDDLRDESGVRGFMNKKKAPAERIKKWSIIEVDVAKSGVRLFADPFTQETWVIDEPVIPPEFLAVVSKDRLSPAHHSPKRGVVDLVPPGSLSPVPREQTV